MGIVISICRCQSDQTFDHFDKFVVRLANFFDKVVKFLGSTYGYLRGVLASPSHCSILIQILLAGKAGQYSDLSIGPVATIDSTILTNGTARFKNCKQWKSVY